MTTNTSLTTRIEVSLRALGIVWFVSGIAFGVHFRDAFASCLFFFWSMPFFIVGWLVTGIPVVAMGNQIFRIPKIILAVSGAVLGIFVTLLPFELDWAISLGAKHFRLGWSDFKGWPAFGAGIGAGGVILYVWLLSRAVHQNKTQT